MSLAGKVVIVTGGSKGIGKATAALLASEGAKVVINYGSDRQSAEETIKELGEDKVTAIQADASSLSGISEIVDHAVCKHGKIDVVIANAGWMPLKGVEAVTEQDFDRAFALNVKGPLFLAQKALPHMPDGSRIIMLSTTQTTASTVTAPYTLYNATKGAVEQLVRCMSKDLGKRDINVNAVAPGPTGTGLFLDGKSDEQLKQIAGFNPKGRIGKPEELAQTIVWLAGPAASWINGQTIRCNGGMA